jgi:hypothetical protein
MTAMQKLKHMIQVNKNKVEEVDTHHGHKVFNGIIDK